MKREKLDLHHEQVISQAFRELDLELSEYSFANLYLFREVHDYQLLFGDELFIKGKTYDGTRFLMPTSKKNLTLSSEILTDEADCFFPIPESWLQSLDARYSSRFLEQDSDYIYDISVMGHYPGRHLSKKRNLVKQFCELYGEAQASLLEDSQKAAAREVLEKWQQHQVSHSDYQSCLEAIDLLSELKLQGTVYFGDSHPIGLVIGEAINKETYVIHFAKADMNYKGVYQYIYERFAQSLEGKYRWLNMEQDLGDPHLQQSKHSYQPVRMDKKFRVSPSTL